MDIANLSDEDKDLSDEDIRLSPKSLSDLFALLLVVLVAVSVTLTILASNEGRGSGLWSALGAVGSASQALFVGTAVLVAMREIRSHFQLAERVRSEVVMDQVLAVAFREVGPGIRRLHKTGDLLSQLATKAMEQELRREFKVAPEHDGALQAEFERVRTEFVRVVEDLHHGCLLLETYCSLSVPDEGWHQLACRLSEGCEKIADPPMHLGMCTSTDPSRIDQDVALVSASWNFLAAAVTDGLANRLKPRPR